MYVCMYVCIYIYIYTQNTKSQCKKKKEIVSKNNVETSQIELKNNTSKKSKNWKINRRTSHGAFLSLLESKAVWYKYYCWLPWRSSYLCLFPLLFRSARVLALFINNTNSTITMSSSRAFFRVVTFLGFVSQFWILEIRILVKSLPLTAKRWSRQTPKILKTFYCTSLESCTMCVYFDHLNNMPLLQDSNNQYPVIGRQNICYFS